MAVQEIHAHIHLHGVPDHGPQLTRMETAMATAAQQLADLDGRFDDFTGDVRAKLAILAADRDNFSEAGQAAFDALSTKLAVLDTEIGDADGSDIPPADPDA